MRTGAALRAAGVQYNRTGHLMDLGLSRRVFGAQDHVHRWREEVQLVAQLGQLLLHRAGHGGRTREHLARRVPASTPASGWSAVPDAPASP